MMSRRKQKKNSIRKLEDSEKNIGLGDLSPYFFEKYGKGVFVIRKRNNKIFWFYATPKSFDSDVDLAVIENNDYSKNYLVVTFIAESEISVLTTYPLSKSPFVLEKKMKDIQIVFDKSSSHIL